MFVFYKSLHTTSPANKVFLSQSKKLSLILKFYTATQGILLTRKLVPFKTSPSFLHVLCQLALPLESAQALLVWTSHTTSNLQMKKESPGTEQTEIINLNINTQTSVYSNDYESNII